MSLKNATEISIIIYLIVLLLPTILIKMLLPNSAYFDVVTWDYIIGAGLLLVIQWRTKQKNTIEHPAKWDSIVLYGVLGFIYAFIAEIVGGLFERLIAPNITSSQNTAVILKAIKLHPIFIIATVIAAPIMEELIFRKAIFANLIPFIGEVWAAIIASLLFALAHNDGHLLVYVLISLVLCYIYKKSGSIYSSMIAHILLNSMVVLVSIMV